MKKVELKTVEIEGGNIDYKEQILAVLRAPSNPNAGTNYEEMGKVLPILQKVDEAGDVLLLEDAEHTIVCDRLKGARFGTNHPALFEMIKDILGAPKHLVEADATAN